MQELIELIQSGDLTNNQILRRITVIHDQNCDELDEAMDTIKDLEAKDTLNQLTILELHQKLNATEGRLRLQATTAKDIEKSALQAIAQAKVFQNQNTVMEAKLVEFNQMKADMKKLRPQVKRLRQAGKNSAKRNIKHMKEKKLFRLARDKALLECAKISMTGFKKVGKYTFSLFPLKVNTETGERKIAITVADDYGSMKALTRTSTGEIIQPKSHNFKFKADQTEFLENVFDVIEAGNHVFTNELLRLVK